MALALVGGLLAEGLPASAATADSHAGAASKAASLAVKIVDLPRGASGSVQIKGPDGYKRDVASSVTVGGLKPGAYAVSAASVSAGGTTYVPSVTGASVTLKAGQSATSTVAYYTRIPSTTRAVAAGDVTSVTGSASGTQIVVVTGVAAVKAGDIIAVGTGSATPDGLLAKVTAVKASGKRQTLTTVPATLQQAIPQGSFSATTGLGETSTVSSQAGTRPGLARGAGGTVLTCGAGGSVTAGWSLTSSVTTAFTSSWSLAGVTATATATASEASEVNASATVGASCTLGPLAVGPARRLAPIVRFIGYVPIVIFPTVQAVLKGSVSVSGAASASASQRFTATAGLSYDNGAVSAIHDVSNVTSYSSPTVGATASLDMTVGPQVTLSLYGVGGPVINVDPGLNLTYNSNANPPWALDAVLRAGVSLSVPKLHISASDPDVIDLSYPLASGGTPKANWGDALALAGDDAEITAIACPAPGDCSAGGFNNSGGFLISETDGTWGKPQFPGIESVSALSCVSAGNCVAASTDDAGNDFLATEVDGVWGPPQAIPGLAALGQAWAVDALSCAPAGDSTFCAAGGFYRDAEGNRQAFIVDGSGGTWGNATEFPGTAALNQGGLASVNAISCVPAGKSAVCAAGGDFSPGISSGGTVSDTGFVADETGGTWGQALPLNVGIVTSVSCASAGDCTAVGGYNDSAGNEQAFGVTESDGTWGTPEGIASPFGTGELFAVSCASPGNCAAAGTLDVSQVKGAWGKAQALTAGATAPTGQMDAVSCTAQDYCVASGLNYSAPSYSANWDPIAYVATDTAGTWTYATAVPGSGKAQGFAAACTLTGGYCVAAGTDDLTSSGDGNAFVSSATSTKAKVKLSTGTVAYGKEGSEKVTVTITAASGAEPTGTVFVSVGSVFTCQITLKAGTGSCDLAARSLPPGLFQTIASYYGVPGFYGSTSEPSPLTVTGHT